MVNGNSRKKRHTTFEKLNHADKQLREYLETKDSEKLYEYRLLLKPAISRLRSLLLNARIKQYDKLDELEKDYLYTDIEMLYYSNKDGSLVMSRLEKINKENYPKDIKEITDKRRGIYKDSYGREHYSVRISANYYLDELTKKWLEEIPSIEEVIIEKGETETLPKFHL